MVDALRMTRRWLVPAGHVVDLHPTAEVAQIFVGTVAAGPIDPGGATARHQGATDAIAAAARERVFRIEDAVEFEFFTHADSLDELESSILENWREARVGTKTRERARALLEQNPGGRVCVRERVAASRLRLCQSG